MTLKNVVMAAKKASGREIQRKMVIWKGASSSWRTILRRGIATRRWVLLKKGTG